MAASTDRFHLRATQFAGTWSEVTRTMIAFASRRDSVRVDRAVSRRPGPRMKTLSTKSPAETVRTDLLLPVALQRSRRGAWPLCQITPCNGAMIRTCG